MAHGAILGQSIPDLQNTYLALDGSNSMTGTLRADGGITINNRASELSLFPNTSRSFKVYDDSSYGTSIAVSNTLWITSNNSQNGTIGFKFNSADTFVIKLNEIRMGANLNINSNKIINLADGTADTDAATVGQLNAAVANVITILSDTPNNNFCPNKIS